MSSYIDREAFRKDLVERKNNTQDFNKRHEISCIIEMLDSIPDQSEGEWVQSDIPQEKYVCSVCGGACWYYDYQGEVAKSRFCPNCGAKMRKEDEGK